MNGILMSVIRISGLVFWMIRIGELPPSPASPTNSKPSPCQSMLFFMPSYRNNLVFPLKKPLTYEIPLNTFSCKNSCKFILSHLQTKNTEDFGCPGLFVQYLLHPSLDKPSLFRHIQKVRYISFFEYGKAGRSLWNTGNSERSSELLLCSSPRAPATTISPISAVCWMRWQISTI